MKNVCRECWFTLFVQLRDIGCSLELVEKLVNEFNGYVSCEKCEKDGLRK